jgi:histidinol-phosphatase (PHP family)
VAKVLRKIDYHVHPDYSIDADRAKIKDYCYRALELNLEEICFTTHLEFGLLEEGKDNLVSYRGKPWSILRLEWLDDYFTEIHQAQQEFKRQGLKVKAGVEIGFHREYENDIAKIVNQYPFDYVLGAIHCLQGYSIASKYESIDYFANRDLATVGHEYFTLLEEAVKSGFFDAIAHLDIYCRYGSRHFGDQISTIHRGIVEPILKEMSRRNMALEINTSSLSRGLKEFHPSREIVAMAVKAGAKIFTVGSDAHKLEELGRHIDEALALLKDFNLNPHVFTRHKAEPFPTDRI